MNHFSLYPSIPVVVRIATAENFAQDKNVFFFFFLFSCLSFYSGFYTGRTPTAFIYILIYILKSCLYLRAMFQTATCFNSSAAALERITAEC